MHIPGLMSWVNNLYLRLFTAVLLIGLILLNLDRNRLWEEMQQINPSVCLVMLMVNILLLGLFAKRWQIIAGMLGIRAPLSRYFRAIWASQFAGQFGPTVIMAESTRFYMIHRSGGTWQTATSQLVDRVSGQLVLFGMIVVMSPFYFRLLDIDVEKWFCIVISVVLLSGLFGRNLLARLFTKTSLKSDFLLNLFNPQKSCTHLLLSLMIQILLIANFGLAAFAVSPEFDWVGFVLLTPLVFGCLTLLPISVSDWGTREISALLILNNLGLELEKVVSLSLLFGLMNLLSALPGAFCLIQREAEQDRYSHSKPVGVCRR